ncbi:hypothetical protein BJV77DRAFT_696006 [Russula vinacea]|nr:hypothetical protein BJV77DRAFT_696006 [Russula vinacea]
MCSYQAPGLYDLAKLSRLHAAPPSSSNWVRIVSTEGIRSALERPWLCCFHGTRVSWGKGGDAIAPHPRSISPDVTGQTCVVRVSSETFVRYLEHHRVPHSLKWTLQARAVPPKSPQNPWPPYCMWRRGKILSSLSRNFGPNGAALCSMGQSSAENLQWLHPCAYSAVI